MNTGPSDDSDVAIFWDYENCPVPANSSGHVIAKNIRSLTRSFGCVKVFKAYLETSNQTSTLRSELQSSGVTLVDCPHNGKKEVADKMILVDMMTYALDNPAPSTIFVISGDRDFAYAISILNMRQYQVVLIAGPNARPALTTQTDICFEWLNDVVKCQTGAPERQLRRPSEQQRDAISEPPIVINSSPSVPVTDFVEGDSTNNTIGLVPSIRDRAAERQANSAVASFRQKSQEIRAPNGDPLSTCSTLLNPSVPPFSPFNDRKPDTTTVQETHLLTPLRTLTVGSVILAAAYESAEKTPLLVDGKQVVSPSQPLSHPMSILQEDVVEPPLVEDATKLSEPDSQGCSLSWDTPIRPATAPPTSPRISEVPPHQNSVIQPTPCEGRPPPQVPVIYQTSVQSYDPTLDSMVTKPSEETFRIDESLANEVHVKAGTPPVSSLPSSSSTSTSNSVISNQSVLQPFSVTSFFTTPTSYVPPKPKAIPNTPNHFKLPANLPSVSQPKQTPKSKSLVVPASPAAKTSVPAGSGKKNSFPAKWAPLFDALRKNKGALLRNKIAAEILDAHPDAFQRAGHQRINTYLNAAVKAGYVKLVDEGGNREVRLARAYAS